MPPPGCCCCAMLTGGFKRLPATTCPSRRSAEWSCPATPLQARVFELVYVDGRPTGKVLKINHAGGYSRSSLVSQLGTQRAPAHVGGR